MIVGLVLSGLLFGTLAGGIGLAMGMSFWAVLLIYSALGMASLLAGAMLIMYRTSGHVTSEGSMPMVGPDL